MDIEVGKAEGAETPASIMTEYVVERITALMVMAGMESISAQRFECGLGSRLHVTISAFAGAPKDVTDQGIVIKDALAQIMSVANVVRIVIKPSESDLSDMKASWADSAKRAKNKNSGGAGDQVAPADGEINANIEVPGEK